MYMKKRGCYDDANVMEDDGEDKGAGSLLSGNCRQEKTHGELHWYRGLSLFKRMVEIGAPLALQTNH
jgi:hypothetical protein